MAPDPESNVSACTQQIEKQLDWLLPRASGPESILANAMRHALLDCDAYFHGVLVCATSELFAVDPDRSLRVAAAAECALAYSRAHDDLPCMDNRSRRRGKPTVHVKFGEVTSILAGDALLALAFDTLVDEATHQNPSVRCGLVEGLSSAAGGHGVAGGQLHDMYSSFGESGIGEIARLQQMKIGALISFACEAGVILGQGSRAARHALRAFAHDLGLARQIMIDVRSAEKAGDAEKSKGHATFVTLLGLERARTQAIFLTHQSRQHIEIFDNKSEFLSAVVDFVLSPGEHA
jgi:farnesyl diphosphate synthase